MGRESIKTSGAAASATRRGAPGRRIAHTIAAALFGCTVLAAAAAPAESEPRAANGLIVGHRQPHAEMSRIACNDLGRR